MLAQRPVPSSEGRRIVICDYNALLLSVTGLLRMSGYCVFQAHDGLAAQELCIELPEISLLMLNTYGTGIDVGDLIRASAMSSRACRSSISAPPSRRPACRCPDAGRGVHPGPSPYDGERAHRAAGDPAGRG